MYMLVFPQISNFNMSMQRFKSNIDQMDLTTSMIRILHVIEGEFWGGGGGGGAVFAHLKVPTHTWMQLTLLSQYTAF